MTNRYTVQGAQGEFQPGSNDLVLANKLGIHSVEEMNELELYLLQQLYEEVLLAQIPRLLADFERSCLARWTPCHGMDTDPLAEAMAITHVEFILIHPFREGNGRLSRLLADVMAVQSGRGPLDYSAWNAHKAAYIQAIHQGVEMNYAPMKQLFVQALNAGQA